MASTKVAGVHFHIGAAIRDNNPLAMVGRDAFRNSPSHR